MIPVYKAIIIDSLMELADQKMQMEYWCGGDPSKMSSLTEAVEGIFSDSGFDYVREKGQVVFSPEIDQALDDFADKLLQVKPEPVDEASILSPQMDRIRARAKELLERIKRHER